MAEMRAEDWAAARGEQWRAQLPFMEKLLKPIDAPLIDALQLDAPYRIADIGCGGGGTTLDVAQRAPAGSVIRGFDISPALIEAARDRVRDDARDIAFEIADMATAPAPDGLFERIVSRFGTMFFDDPPAAFANVARWLSPGGRFAFAVWGPLTENPWFTNLRDAVASVVDVPKPDPQGPGPFRYGDAQVLVALLEDAGFHQVHVRDWRGALATGAAAPQVAHLMLDSLAGFRELLEQAGGTARADAQAELTTRLAAFEHDGVVQMVARVHLVTGGRR